MIVNPAYIYMGKTPAVEDFPLWGNGSLNVPLEADPPPYGASFDSKTNKVRIGNSSAGIFTVNATNYSKLKINTNSYGSVNIRIYITPGSVNVMSYTVPASPIDIEYAIPEAYRKENLQIRIESAGTLFLNSAILSN